ncbi:hypothetical protein J6590_054978 [Homalodisca vitripennis]|nr:hypothetical protein J6590_054978 [Homalodisca vitripennis]
MIPLLFGHKNRLKDQFGNKIQESEGKCLPLPRKRRLCSAAKKALSKIPTKHIKLGDKATDTCLCDNHHSRQAGQDMEVQGDGECCAICIEPYRTSEVVRILPCRHEFHRGCIDPWLVEHRTCPMCKMDILKHYGFVFTGSQESILHMDIEEVVSESESLHHHVAPRSRSLSPAPRSTSQRPEEDVSGYILQWLTLHIQFQIGTGFVQQVDDQLSRAPSPDEMTPSLPQAVGRPETVTGCSELLSVMPISPLRRSLSLDNCSQELIHEEDGDIDSDIEDEELPGSVSLHDYTHRAVVRSMNQT